MNAIESLIPQNQIEPLKERLADYYLPAFSLDDTHAPEVFVISVYKRPYTDSTCAIIRITRQGIVVSNETPEPPIGKAIADGDVDFAGGVELKPSYHTTSDLKDGTWDSKSAYVVLTPPSRSLETIACTKGWYDSVVVENRVINAKIFAKVIQDTFRVLSEEDRDKLKEKYEEVELEIDDYMQVLDSLDTIKAATIDLIDTREMAKDSYNVQAPSADFPKGTQGIPIMIRQAFLDISRLPQRINEDIQTKGFRKSGNAGKFSKYRLTDNQNPVILHSPARFGPVESGSSAGKVPLSESAYSTIINTLSSLDNTDNVPFENIAVSDKQLKAVVPSFDEDLIRLKGRPIFGSSSENPWINQWYFENVIKKMGDNDPSFDNLNTYIDVLDGKIDSLLRNFNYYTGKGGQLLTEQAVMKSILSLCESNIDVSTYAPRLPNGRSIFDLLSKSAMLGPQGTVPYPNVVVDNDDPEKEPEPFSKTGFLCYHALLKELKKTLSQGKDSAQQFSEYKEWLATNLVSSDSDHDMTLQLASKLVADEDTFNSDASNRDLGRRITIQDGLFLYSPSGQFGMDRKPDSKVRFLNLYKDQERVSWLPPQNRREDTYFKWYQRGRVTELADDENIANVSPVFTVFGLGGITSSDGGQVAETSDATKATEYSSTGANLLMGFTGDAVVIRTKKVHYGWPAKYHEANTDVRGFFKDRAYSLPQIWGSTVSILRTLVITYVENMIESYKEITGTDAELRAPDVLASMSIRKRIQILDLILYVVEMIEVDNTVNIEFYINGDGSKSIFTSTDTRSSTVTTPGNLYSNTSGQNLRGIVHDYLKFVAKISSHKSLQIVNSQAGKTLPYATFIPVEAFDNNANPNVVLKHYPPPDEEVANIYFQPSILEPYYDRLEWSTDEFKKGLLIKRSSTGIRQEAMSLDTGINLSHKSFLRRHKIDFQHMDFLTKYANYLKAFQSNLETLEIKQSVVKLFEDGVLDSDEKLGEPGLMVKQIRARREYYRAGPLGVSERYRFSKLLNSSDAENQMKEIEYIYVLGIYEEAWDDTDKNDDSTIKLKCFYKPIVGIESIEIAEYDIRYMEDLDPNPYSTESMSSGLLDYMHVVRGLDLREHAFSDHTNLIYEDDVVKNDSEIFPWTKDDFEENKPTKPLDTIWSMSPWVFPRNYFHDTTSYHKYHRVVALPILKNTVVTKIPPQHDSDEIDLIGTLYWEIINE